MKRRGLWWVLVVAAGCGARPGGETLRPVVISIPTPADAGAPIAVAPAPTASVQALPPGSNGPRDPVSLIGAAGAVSGGDPETVLLVNSAEIRAHPARVAFGRAMLAVLAGWNLFMPVDVVEPLDEVDWVLVSGSPLLGSTEENVIVSHYTLAATQASTVKALLARLPNARRGKAPVELLAHVDRADRAYLFPQPNLVAIVPPAKAISAAQTLAAATVPARVRPGELARAIWNGARAGYSSFMPAAVQRLRLWITSDERGELRLSGEGDCASAEQAEEAASELRTLFDNATRSAVTRLLLGRLVAGSSIWTDGATVRYDAPLPEAILDFVATAVGCPTPCQP